MSIEYRFVEAVDTLSFRGNRLFDGAGAYGESQFPPYPSVLAGAFRSMMLTRCNTSLAAFAGNTPLAEPILASVLGTPDDPGSFHIAYLSPAFKRTTGEVQPLVRLPADLLVTDQAGRRCITRMEPVRLTGGIQTGLPEQLPYVPVVRQAVQGKPERDWLLTMDGLSEYLRGEAVTEDHLVPMASLWKRDVRVGIGMDAATRSAEEGHLFSVEHIALAQAEHRGQDGTAGLLVGISGCEGQLPDAGVIRLGGDGKAAAFQSVSAIHLAIPEKTIRETRRCKVVLQTPALFEQGWLPDGLIMEQGHQWYERDGFKMRLACAAIPGYEVVSGWDLAKRAPKAAQRVVPAGSVYWFDQLEGDLEMPCKLAEQGFWLDQMQNSNKSRWAEGYNRVLVAAW